MTAKKATTKRATKKTPRKKEESNLLARIRLTFGARPDFLIARINTGVFKVDALGGREGRVRSAPDGFPDVIGTQLRRIEAQKTIEGGFMRYESQKYWAYIGQAIAIETKAKNGVLSEAQKNWRDAFQRVGGIYIVAKTLDDVWAVLGDVPEWVRGIGGTS